MLPASLSDRPASVPTARPGVMASSEQAAQLVDPALIAALGRQP
jgi:hypothetical protein